MYLFVSVLLYQTPISGIMLQKKCLDMPFWEAKDLWIIKKSVMNS